MVRKSKDTASVEGHPGSRHIAVSAQQSRYALDAVDAPASNEILIRDLSIAVANKELLSRTTLHLVEARHYLLAGRNGTGKSTLLKAIADGLVPGIPPSTQILLLGQTREGADAAEPDRKREEETVLQHVVRSDRVRERCTREADMLADAIENARDAMAPVRAYRRIQSERLACRLREAHRVAERRSGARGKLARKELIRLEERCEEAKSKVDEEEGEVDAKQVSEDTQAAADMLSGVQASLELMDAGAAEARARKVLLGLGFKQDRIDQPRSQLSGGWQTRCDLACALTQHADVLLLDEPTNFLDLASIIWLQDCINSMTKTTMLITTHDRDFGDAVAEELILLRNQVLETFRGNLSLYEKEKHRKIQYLTKMKDAKDKQKKHVEKSIAGSIKAAKDKGDDKKLKQAASRQKKLDERWGVEVGLKGGRFKLNRDLGGYHTTARAEIEIPDFDPPVKLSFPRQPPELRFPGALVSMEKVVFAYPGREKAPTLTDVSLTIHAGTRTGLAGLNGSGKTTLVSLIAGSLVPTSGTIARHARVKIGRFSQHSVEEMTAMASSDAKLTALRHVMQAEGRGMQAEGGGMQAEGGGMEAEGGGMEEKEARQMLGSLGLHGQTVSEVPLVLLSGGQKVRVALAKLLWPPPQLLILDEVTTHLDADTIVSLVLALKDYDGALVVVTHDRFFMRTVVEGASPHKLAPRAGGEDEAGESESSGDEAGAAVGAAGTVYRVTKGQVKRLEGGMEQYAELAGRTAAKLGRTSGG
ncbi:ABC transporter ATP-binding protein uup-1 [Didymella exigua CBS 183.55]|uniref:ABC transporter ATP-binding protein uup-1 n=1 Tax=Didymella exigua CBS 183.55 TaxID=1150837 RepID=A0A6A5RHR6_9PLEO|nr:ABC transporter ATP-binding protein uup-1 [Didymella exigua CBS 183.55]KAF1925147.1 ABC transporter ATP-binding protein uup-1 [Didymella exigua CBS 183.55]